MYSCTQQQQESWCKEGSRQLLEILHYPASLLKTYIPMKVLIIWHGHTDGEMLGPQLLHVSLFFVSTYLFCSAHLACGWCRAGFFGFIYSSINTAQPCHGFHLAGGTGWQDSCLQHITVQQPPPKCPFLRELVVSSLQPSCPITFNPPPQKN